MAHASTNTGTMVSPLSLLKCCGQRQSVVISCPVSMSAVILVKYGLTAQRLAQAGPDPYPSWSRCCLWHVWRMLRPTQVQWWALSLLKCCGQRQSVVISCPVSMSAVILVKYGLTAQRLAQAGPDPYPSWSRCCLWHVWRMLRPTQVQWWALSLLKCCGQRQSVVISCSASKHRRRSHSCEVRFHGSKTDASRIHVVVCDTWDVCFDQHRHNGEFSLVC